MIIDAYNQMAKCKSMAGKYGHDIMNVYLDDIKFNPRSWYTDGVNEDKIEYDDDIQIDNLTDETVWLLFNFVFFFQYFVLIEI